jgi:preprotein translocase subunit YajC
LKLSVDSEDLIALNSFIKTQFPFVSEYLIYQPHMTIAYLKKGVGSKLVEKYKNDSNKVFLKMSDFTYSDSNKKKYNFNALDSVSKNRFAENLFKGEENDLSLFELDLEKSYKYIKREPDGKGGWKYFYAEDMKPVSQSKEEKGILNTKTGLNIENYSDKAILVSGDTLSQKDLLRKVKDELGVGTFNPKLKGWVFPSKFVDKILGFFWTDALNKNEELADEIQNTKNESLQKGDEVSVNGLEGKISNPVSDENGIKYDIKLNNGVELNGVDEKMLEAKPQTKSKEIEETINSASEETRAKVEKKLYGLKPIENLHSYSLEEVLSMNGISDAEIREALDKLFTKKEDSGEKKTTTRSYSSITKKAKKMV